MSKGEHTRAAILDVALAQASEAGFESLTIGSLAERAGLSKSGLFAHFGSREELQVAAIEAAAARFTEIVFLPALKARRGLPRLHALFDNWLGWTARSGLRTAARCMRPPWNSTTGRVRCATRSSSISRGSSASWAAPSSSPSAKGHLRKDLEVEQFVFDMLGIIFAYHHGARLFDVAGPNRRPAPPSSG